MIAIITQKRFLSMQVCVPKEWDDQDIIDFAEKENPSGTSCGWLICEGNTNRVQCDTYKDNCHVVLHV